MSMCIGNFSIFDWMSQDYQPHVRTGLSTLLDSSQLSAAVLF